MLYMNLYIPYNTNIKWYINQSEFVSTLIYLALINAACIFSWR